MVDAEALLMKLAKDHTYVMTQDEATDVWAEYHALIQDNRRLQTLSFLRDRLESETIAGSRCAVCARVDDPRCVEDC